MEVELNKEQIENWRKVLMGDSWSLCSSDVKRTNSKISR